MSIYHRNGQRSKKIKIPRGRDGVRPRLSPNKTVEGILQIKGRFGFILSDKENVPDVLVQGPSLKMARDGDRVCARLLSSCAADRQSGEVTDVLTRARKTAVGAICRINDVSYLVPEDEDFRVRFKDPKCLAPAEGYFAVDEITRWPSKAEDAEGVLTEVLGPAKGPGVDLLTVIRRFELPDTFPPVVVAEADAFGDEVSPESLEGRTHFFDETVVTIDGEDAADFDDAVSIQSRPGGGWKLCVNCAR